MRRLYRNVALGLTTVLLMLGAAGTAAADGPVHVVQPGETLFRIALNFGVSMDAIRAANGIVGNTIYAGQAMVIPLGGSSDAPPPPAPTEAPPTGTPPANPPPTDT